MGLKRGGPSCSHSSLYEVKRKGNMSVEGKIGDTERARDIYAPDQNFRSHRAGYLASDLTLVPTFPLNFVRRRPSFSPLALLPRIHSAAALSSHRALPPPTPPRPTATASTAYATRIPSGTASVSTTFCSHPAIRSHCEQDPLLPEAPIQTAVAAMAAALKRSLISIFFPSTSSSLSHRW